jgi:hypothetical protein
MVAAMLGGISISPGTGVDPPTVGISPANAVVESTQARTIVIKNRFIWAISPV